MRDRIFAALLAIACLSIDVGVAMWSLPLACIIAGVLLAGWAWLVIVFGEAGAPGAKPAAAATHDELEVEVPAYPVPGGRDAVE